MNQLEKIRNFHAFLFSGGHETWRKAKKVTACDSAQTGPHTHMCYFESGIMGTMAVFKGGAERA